jgi:hypothetical protein
MATNKGSDEGGVVNPEDHEQGPDEQRMLREIIALVERKYNAWVGGTEGLESPQAQMVVFAQVTKRLAQAGIGLGAVITQAGRAFGVNFEQLEITDEQGRSLVQRGVVLNPDPVNDVPLVPGSKRDDN